VHPAHAAAKELLEQTYAFHVGRDAVLPFGSESEGAGAGVPSRMIHPSPCGGRPQAVAALTRIFLREIERLLCEAAGGSCGDDAPAAPRPRPGAVSFLHRFGSAINRHVHLHAYVTDGVFMPNGDGPPAFLPARPITQADLASLAEKVRRRVVRWCPLCAAPSQGGQLGRPGTRA